MTKKESFLYLDRLLEMVELQMDINKVMFVLIGNKADLYDKWKIKESDAKKFADILQAKFFLSNAKNEPVRFREFLDQVFQEYIKLYFEGSDLPNQIRQQNIILNRRNRRRARLCYI